MADRAPDLIQRAAARLQLARNEVPMPAEVAAREWESSTAGAPQPAELESVEAISGAASLQPAPTQHLTISPAILAANGLAFPSSSYSRTTEEFRALKRYVLANSLSQEGANHSAARRIIMVTSARAGDGKTFTAINLALALAYEKETRVLLVDADAYRQSLMTYLGVAAETGWLDLVSAGRGGADEFIHETNIAGLSVLPSGKERAGIPELMASRQMNKLLIDLVNQDQKRLVILDSLPCLSSTEPSILAGVAGQTLFVVAAHRTSREDVESSLRLLHASPSVSLVLNKAEPLLAEQFKGYGYGYRR